MRAYGIGRLAIGAMLILGCWGERALAQPKFLKDLPAHPEHMVLEAPMRRGVYAMVFSPKDELLAASFDDGSIWLWEFPVGKVKDVLQPRGSIGRQLAFTCDGKKLRCISGDPSGLQRGNTLVETLEIASGKAGEPLRFAGGSRVIAADGERAIVVPLEPLRRSRRSEAAFVHYFDPDHVFVELKAAHKEGVRNTALSPDGRLAATAGEDGLIRLWELPLGTERSRMQMGSALTSLDFSDNSKWLLTVGGGDSKGLSSDRVVHFWDTGTGKLIGQRFPQTTLIGKLSPDGRILAMSRATHIEIWDVAKREPVALLQFSEKHQAHERMVFSHDGRFLAAAGLHSGGRVHLWAIPKGKQ